MIDTFLSPGAFPFAIALAVVAGLFILEILSALLGGSILGVGSDAPDVDADFDLSSDFEADLGVDLEAEAPDATFDGGDAGEATSGLLTWIGARDVPFLIWLVSFLTMFGLCGLILQWMVFSIVGAQMPAWMAVAVASIPALAVTRVIANWVALLMPKTESSAMKTRRLGGHRGVITQGTAARGRPAEAKIKDRYDNIHYLRVEPLRDEEVFPQGSDVTVIRKRGDKFFVI